MEDSAASSTPEAASAPKPLAPRQLPWHTTSTLLLALLLACVLFVANEWSYRSAEDSLHRLGKINGARQATQLLMRRLLDAESAQRGYLLTARRDYLIPGADAEQDVRQAIAELRKHYSDNPKLTGVLEDMARRAEERLSELQETVALYDRGDQGTAMELVLTDIGREKMDAVRSAALSLLAAEEQRFLQERAAVYRTLEVGRFGVHVGTVLALMWLIFYLRKSATLQAVQEEYALNMQTQRDSLDSQVRLRTAELTTLNQQLQVMREVERGRLARTLHDELGALLTTAKFDLARLRRALGPQAPAVEDRISHLTLTLDRGIDLKRSIMEDLTPSLLHNIGLREALETLAGDFAERAGTPVELDLDTVLANENSRITAYRLVEGVLSNIERHTQAKGVHIQLKQSGPAMTVQIVDDGVDFDTGWALKSSDALKNLRHRIEMLGGELTLRSAPQVGTEVVASIPLQGEVDDPAQPSPCVN